MEYFWVDDGYGNDAFLLPLFDSNDQDYNLDVSKIEDLLLILNELGIIEYEKVYDSIYEIRIKRR